MGNCLTICRSRKESDSEGTNNMTQIDIVSNQIDPRGSNNESGVSLNNGKNQNNDLHPRNNEQLIQINNELKNKFKTILEKNEIYYQDMKKINEYISNYKSFLNDLNHELNNYHEQLNISIRGKKLGEPLSNKKYKSQLLKELDQVSFKIKELNSILDNQKSEIKNLVNYKIIQEKLNEKENDFNQEKLISQNNKIISNQLKELEQISIRLQKNKSLYEDKKDEIEEDIKSIQKKN